MQDWVPEGHLARFIIDVCRDLDLSDIIAYYESDVRGAPPYHPRMMVAIILYGYAIGRNSSRGIARAMEDDVAFRVIGAGNAPRHTAIGEFRRIHLDRLAGLFTQVLMLCREAGLVKLGNVSIDGTKMKANAALAKSRTHAKLEKEERELRERIARSLREAQRRDEEDDELYGSENRGDELPPGLRGSRDRLRRIREAKESLEERQRGLYEEHQEHLEERRRKEEDTGKKLRGRKPKDVSETPDEKKKRNMTDPESRIMKTAAGHVQGYNAQAAVDVSSQVIIAADVTQEENDKHQLVPMLRRVEQENGRLPDRSMLDAGYWTEAQIEQLEDEVDLYVATSKDWKRRKAIREMPPPRGRIPNDYTRSQRMERKLRTKRGRALYKLRSSSVEPVFGQIKSVRRLDRFLLRGIEKVKAEWSLMTLTHNLLKLQRSGWSPG